MSWCLGEAEVSPVPVVLQCAAVCTACATVGLRGMGAACALLATRVPTVTKVSRAAGAAWDSGSLC